jgi:hypothetical protein
VLKTMTRRSAGWHPSDGTPGGMWALLSWRWHLHDPRTNSRDLDVTRRELKPLSGVDEKVVTEVIRYCSGFINHSVSMLTVENARSPFGTMPPMLPGPAQ